MRGASDSLVRGRLRRHRNKSGELRERRDGEHFVEGVDGEDAAVGIAQDWSECVVDAFPAGAAEHRE